MSKKNSTTKKLLIGSGIFLIGYALWKNRQQVQSFFNSAISGIGKTYRYPYYDGQRK
jgi:hypothetical protein